MAAPAKVEQQKNHLPFLDGIRGTAILAVFLYHSLGIGFGADQLKWNGLVRDFSTSRSFLILSPLTFGWAGVAVFFVVSGFCIHLSHQKCREKGWLVFCNRRFFRIYPPYLLATFAFFFIWPWGSLSIGSPERLVQLGSHLLAVHNLDPETFFGINGSLWSVAVEIQLYAIYPLLLYIVGKKGWKTALIFTGTLEVLIRIAESISVTFYNESIPFIIKHSPFGYWLSWSIGAYLAQCFLEGRTSWLSKVRFDLVAVVTLTVALFKPTEPFGFLAWALLTGMAIDRLISEKWSLPKNRLFDLLWQHLTSLGLISYSFYLFHQPIINITKLVIGNLSPDKPFNPILKLAICLAWYPVIIGFSRFIYRRIEQPSIDLGKVVWEKFGR